MGQENVIPFHSFISKSALLTFCAWSLNVKFSGSLQETYWKTYWTLAHTLCIPAVNMH